MQVYFFFFFFQAEDGIRDYKVTGVQTCALPIARGDEARLPSVRQREGARRGVELPRRRAAAPRAAVCAEGRADRQVADARRRQSAVAAADALQERAAEVQGRRQAIPADPDQRAP